MRKRLRKIDRAQVKVGVLASKGGQQAHPDGTGATLIEIAAAHEFGTSNVPERSFIRRAFEDNTQEAQALMGKLARRIVEDKTSIDESLRILGTWGANLVRRTVTVGDHIPPPLKPETVKRKGSTRPLVDKSHMINSLDYEVDKK